MKRITALWRGQLVLPTILLILGLLLGSWYLNINASRGESATGVLDQPSVQLAEGEALYEANCASCHGMKGEGQSNWRIPNADGVLSPPPHNADGHTWHHPDRVLLEITAKGGSLPNSGMPGFADKLAQPQLEAILEYIKTFWGED